MNAVVYLKAKIKFSIIMYFYLKEKYVDRIPLLSSHCVESTSRFNQLATKHLVTYCWFQIPLTNILAELKFMGFFVLEVAPFILSISPKRLFFLHIGREEHALQHYWHYKTNKINTQTK